LRQLLARVETLLREFVPNLDLNNVANLDLNNAESVLSALSKVHDGKYGRMDDKIRAKGENNQEDDARLASIIQPTGQLHIDEGDRWEFHGASSGALFVGWISEHFARLATSDCSTPFVPVSPLAELPSLDISRPAMLGEASRLGLFRLPARDVALRLCTYAFSYTTCLLRVVHIPSFWKRFDELYSSTSLGFSVSDQRSLALLSAVLALGCMYDIDENDPNTPNSYDDALQEGLVSKSKNCKTLLFDLPKYIVSSTTLRRSSSLEILPSAET
jgi:hypothetical protein